MTSWNDWDPLLEVVVGRVEHKPVHLHDEPATRKKLHVAFDGKASRACRKEPSGSCGASEVSSNTTTAAAHKQSVFDRYTSDPANKWSPKSGEERKALCAQQVEGFVELLKGEGVEVLRPDVVPGWESGAK